MSIRRIYAYRVTSAVNDRQKLLTADNPTPEQDIKLFANLGLQPEAYVA